MAPGHSTQQLRTVVRAMLNDTTIQADVVIAGGVVPWLISGCDAGRTHSDLDVVVPMAAMPRMRRFLKQHGWYVAACDSLTLPQNKREHDFGVIATATGVAVNVAPYEVTPNGIAQYNCTFAASGDSDAMLTVTLPQLRQSQYCEYHQLTTGELLGHYPLALVKATKLITNRPKDHHDIAEIDRIGVEADQVAWYAQILAQMHIVVH